MDIRIGFSESPGVLELNVPDDFDIKGFRKSVEACFDGKSSALWVVDKDGNETAIAGASIAFIKVGSGDSAKRIGFG